MGLFNFLSNPAEQPSKEQFAAAMLAALRQWRPKDQFELNVAEFQITCADGFINLGNVYLEYSAAEPARREDVLGRFVRSCLLTARLEPPADFHDVHPDLLPVVRSRFYLESLAMQAKSRGEAKFNVPQQILGDHLAISLVYDLPTAMCTISQRQLEEWQVTFYEALEASRQNLEQMGNVQVAQLGDGLYASATGDNYDASRLLMLDLIRQFEVQGDYIAMVPNRDTLLVTGSRDAEGLAGMVKIAQESFAQPRPISTVALRLDGEEWTAWLPAADSPLYESFHELRVRTLGAEYNGQKELLDEMHQAKKIDLFVASFDVLENKATGAARSYCVWSDGVDTLLPQTDQVFFFRPREANEGDIAASADWDRVRQVVGYRMTPTGDYPERYRVESFPTDEELAALGSFLV